MSLGRIVVLGGGGMLGHKMFQVLRERFPGVLCTVRTAPRSPSGDTIPLFRGDDVLHGVDAMEPAALESVLSALRPDFVVNCVGVIKQRDEARSPLPSIAVNSLLPHRLASAASRWGGRVIHFSTDCVFDGRRGAYTEDDLSTAEDLYGKSKFLGEVAEPNALTLRTSMIGRELSGHRSLLDWFLSRNGSSIRGYSRVIYSGVTTNHLAALVSSILRDHPDLNGLYQVASEPISKFDLLTNVRDAFGLDIVIEPYETEVSDRSMKCDKLRRAIGYVCPSWPDLIRALADDKTPYGEWLARS